LKPLILGLTGDSHTGKKTVARSLAPSGRLVEETDTFACWWERIDFSSSFHELASIRMKTEGARQWDRMAYSVHDVLVDLLGFPAYGGPDYGRLVKMVKWVCNWPGEAGPLFLEAVRLEAERLRCGCTIPWMERKVAAAHTYFRSEYADHDDPPKFGVVIPDVSSSQERSYVRQHGLLVKLEATPSARSGRAGDGEPYFTQGYDVNEQFDVVIDTTEMTKKQMVEAVLRVVHRELGLPELDHVSGEQQRLRAVQ
jgi:hypothetical protein